MKKSLIVIALVHQFGLHVSANKIKGCPVLSGIIKNVKIYVYWEKIRKKSFPIDVIGYKVIPVSENDCSQSMINGETAVTASELLNQFYSDWTSVKIMPHSYIFGKTIHEKRAIINPNAKKDLNRIKQLAYNDLFKISDKSIEIIHAFDDDWSVKSIIEIISQLLKLAGFIFREGSIVQLLHQNYFLESVDNSRIEYLDSLGVLDPKLSRNDEVIINALQSNTPELVLSAVKIVGVPDYAFLKQLFLSGSDVLKDQIINLYSASADKEDQSKSDADWIRTEFVVRLINDSLHSDVPENVFWAVKQKGMKDFFHFERVFLPGRNSFKIKVIEHFIEQKDKTPFKFFVSIQYKLNKEVLSKLFLYCKEIGDSSVEDFILSMLKENFGYADTYFLIKSGLNALETCGTFKAVTFLCSVKSINSISTAETVARIQNRIGSGKAGWLSVQNVEQEKGSLSIAKENETGK